MSQVAATILEQLGGRQFLMITGAKNLMSTADTLMFRLPGNFAKDGANAVKIKLNGSDLYDLKFSRVRGTKVTEVAAAEGVYGDALQREFTRVTGLYTRL